MLLFFIIFAKEIKFIHMEKARILYVTQEMIPYMRESQMASIARYLPQGTQEKGKEVRIFMPRFGLINERRHQLHEVFRLSGMNIIINDTDHLLIIKVASIPQARIQVYFIDSDDYFKRKFYLHDENNQFFPDNDERSIFFCKGVIETIKKLGWAPDIIHLHGWMSLLIAPFIKQIYYKHPLFSETKIIVSLYDDHFDELFSESFLTNVTFDDLTPEKLPHLQRQLSYVSLIKDALQYSDGIILSNDNIHHEVLSHVETLKIPSIKLKEEDNYIEVINEFYDKILVGESVSC